MRTYLAAFLLALGTAAVCTPLSLWVARRWKLFDPPDGLRKIHSKPIPRIGGVAIAAGFMAPVVGLLFYNNFFALALREDAARITAFLAGAILILALGLYDDLRGCNAWTKLGVQTLVAVLIWSAGLRFESVSILGHRHTFDLLSLPLTILWVAGIINALNLIDGLDGLAAGVAFFAAAALFINAMIDSVPILGLFAAALAGSAMGFLFYNFQPALIFMGDSGSMTIGYVFAAAGLWSASKRSTLLALLLPAVALGLPIADTVLAFFRRALKGQSPFHSDRGHIHHRLLDAGLSHRQAVLALYLVCVVLTGLVAALRVWESSG